MTVMMVEVIKSREEVVIFVGLLMSVCLNVVNVNRCEHVHIYMYMQ